MTTKADDALKTISEVSELLDVPPHVLRFWEGKFISLRPLKRSGGRRYYRPDDIALLRRIKKLLYIDGFKIKGAQKLIRNKVACEETRVKEDAATFNAQTLSAAINLLNDVTIRLAVLKQKLGSNIDSPVA
ncbi:MAG: MerR family transcriptional regulator [Candidatus Puniceispirillaceae bacterium]